MAKVATTVLIVILSYYLKASMGKDKNISSNGVGDINNYGQMIQFNTENSLHVIGIV